MAPNALIDPKKRKRAREALRRKDKSYLAGKQQKPDAEPEVKQRFPRPQMPIPVDASLVDSVRTHDLWTVEDHVRLLELDGSLDKELESALSAAVKEFSNVRSSGIDVKDWPSELEKCYDIIKFLISQGANLDPNSVNSLPYNELTSLLRKDGIIV